MKDLVFKEERPTVDEYNKMRESTSWGDYKNLKVVEEGLASSLFHICVRKNDELVGMGRVIGDGINNFLYSGYHCIQRISGKRNRYTDNE